MIFVTGPLFSGKRDYIRSALGWSEEELRQNAVWDVQDLPREGEDLEALVIAAEIGGGVVPADPEQRRRREDAGRLACLLSARADTVIRVCCGLPQALKGELP